MEITRKVIVTVVPLIVLLYFIWDVAASQTPVRLVGGKRPNEGTVEIYHNGWGTICDDNFGVEEALVICRMLGLPGNATAFQLAHFGQGTGQILLDTTACTGHETDISECQSDGWGRNDCSHGEDAGVRCSEGLHRIRLIGGRGNFEGRIQFNNHGQWTSICGLGFNHNDATVVCRMLGFQSGQALQGGSFVKSSGQLGFGNFQCSGAERNISECGNFSTIANGLNRCNDTEEAAVRCSHTPVRLVGGTLPSEGRVEIQHNGVWGTVCNQGFQLKDADVFCRMLGFEHSAVSVVTDGHFGKGEDPIWLSNPGCHGYESDVYQCDLQDGWDNNTCTHYSDVGIKCEPTEIRLNGGLGPWEGRLEVKLNGHWGSVCDTGFGDAEADVICRMLGYTGRDESHKIYKGSFFGTSYTIHFDRLDCLGNEIDILQCSVDSYSTCSRDATVGLRCAGVHVRLVDGPHTGAGRVEILHHKSWGSICDSKWDDQDATVICNMLATYPLDRNVTGKALHGSHFGYGTGRVWMSDVECNGTEHDIMQCKFDASGGVNCDHTRDAGVMCDFDKPFHILPETNNTDEIRGRVLVFDNGRLNDVCKDGWSSDDARVVCNSVGYWFANSSIVSLYNTSTIHGLNVVPSCNGNEGSIAMCKSQHEWGYGVCSADLEIECTPTDIDSTKIRLVDGTGPWKGRLEVMYNGRWGSFCFTNWDPSNNDVVCRTLGFRNANSSYFAAPKGYWSNTGGAKYVEYASVMFGDLICQGDEDNIGLCFVDYDTSSCGAAKYSTVGIDCSGGITASLSDGRTLSGQVMFHTPNQHSFTSVCASGLNTSSAKVVCAMAGYMDTNPIAIPPVFSTQTHPVLYTSIDCDGSEPHVGQCTTARDNDTCDSTAYISCFNCTRTFDSSSGTLTSPQYPYNYLDNTDCLYSIQTDNFQNFKVLKLVIHDLQLSGDGDLLEIRDGGRQLGKFESSVGNIPNLVTNTGMFSIRFKSNSFGKGARGFNISWSPLEVQDSFQINCEPDGWYIAVNSTILRMLYPDTGVSQIKLSDQNCVGYVDGDLVVFTHSYTECSTMTQVTTDSIVYSNQLLYPESKDPFPLIVHGYRWRVNVECALPRRDLTSTNFHPNQTAGLQTPHIGSSTHYSISLKFFSDGTFYNEITENPVTLKTGQDVYMQVSLNSADVHVKMRLDTCIAKPNINSDTRLTYTLIQNGCVIDPDTTIISQGTHVTRFVFNAFEFPVDHSNVYVSCNATFCKTGDVSSQCSQTCAPHVAIIGRDLDTHAFLDEQYNFNKLKGIN